MPYIHISTTAGLTDVQKHELRESIAGLMPTLPTKTRDNTMIQITPNSFIQMGEADQPCVFADIRLFGPSPLESKQSFASALCALLQDRLGIAPNRMYMNITELNSWVSNGALATRA